MRVRDLNWMQLEEYLRTDDRVVLPVCSTEQHAYLSLETDNIIAERIAAEAAEPLGIPVLPVLPYGLTQGFVAFPGRKPDPVKIFGIYLVLHVHRGKNECVVAVRRSRARDIDRLGSRPCWQERRSLPVTSRSS
jgi:creatinine amidohydrolase/Fe(II)-dependent formamide hydrolase-like protein